MIKRKMIKKDNEESDFICFNKLFQKKIDCSFV